MLQQLLYYHTHHTGGQTSTKTFSYCHCNAIAAKCCNTVPRDRFQRESLQVRHFCDLELTEELGIMMKAWLTTGHLSLKTHNT